MSTNRVCRKLWWKIRNPLTCDVMCKKMKRQFSSHYPMLISFSHTAFLSIAYATDFVLALSHHFYLPNTHYHLRVLLSLQYASEFAQSMLRFVHARAPAMTCVMLDNHLHYSSVHHFLVVNLFICGQHNSIMFKSGLFPHQSKHWTSYIKNCLLIIMWVSWGPTTPCTIVFGRSL